MEKENERRARETAEWEENPWEQGDGNLFEYVREESSRSSRSERMSK